MKPTFALQGRYIQMGVALLAAMLTVTLVAAFASAALWQQWRGIEVEAAERGRLQSEWLLTGALDWARLILREDARAGDIDHLSEPWAVPLNDARLSNFLSADRNPDSSETDAFLSGQIVDLQGRLNITNLIETNVVSESGISSFKRLFATLGLPSDQLDLLTSNLLRAAQTSSLDADASLMPERISELVWLGMTPETLRLLSPHITLLPVRTPVNLNTAGLEVLHAATPGMEMADAQKLMTARQLGHFRALTDVTRISAGRTGAFNESLHTFSSRFFEVRGNLRLEQTTVQQRSLLQRDGLEVRTLWRQRSVVAQSLGRAP